MDLTSKRLLDDSKNLNKHIKIHKIKNVISENLEFCKKPQSTATNYFIQKHHSQVYDSLE